MGVVLLPRAIRRELARIGTADITFQNLGDGYGLLQSESDGKPFRWQGKARAALERLRQVPDGAGSEAVVSTFATE